MIPEYRIACGKRRCFHFGGEWSGHGHRVPFFDLRVPALYALAIIFLPLLAIGRRHPPLNLAARFVLVFAAVAYVLWLVLFSVWRYLLPIEMLAPVLITVLVGVIVRARMRRVACLRAPPCSPYRTHHASSRLGPRLLGSGAYGVRVPLFHAPIRRCPDGGTAPTAFMIPFFPPHPLHPARGLQRGDVGHDTGLYRIGEERVRAHQNDIYVLYGFDQEASARTVAAISRSF